MDFMETWRYKEGALIDYAIKKKDCYLNKNKLSFISG